MGAKTQTALKLYLQGIRDGNVDCVDECTGDRYTQHSTGVADGAEGFKAYFTDFLKRSTHRDIRVIRCIEDGQYVFAHVYQDINKGEAKWITTDLFDTDSNDKMIEHWDVIAAYVEPEKSVSGNDPVLGEFTITDHDKTEENKVTVRNFLTEVFQNGRHEALEKYISSEQYVQHDAAMENGIQAVRDLLAKEDFCYDFIFKIIGEGDHVVAFSKATHQGQELAVFDIWRLENGKLVEHWDNIEPIPPREEWANTGKF